MDKIKSKLSIKDSILPTAYWDMTKSGKVLELRVKPTIDREPAKYRLGVIQIGRIISRIETMAEQSGSQPQIQLFPNLSENRLAATVYWPGFAEGIKTETPKEIRRTPLSDASIRVIAKNYDLAITPDESLASDDGRNSVYYIVSTSNQPFIWLKLGQFIQDLKNQFDASPSSCNLSLEVLNNVEPDKPPSNHQLSYKQAKVYVTRTA